MRIKDAAEGLQPFLHWGVAIPAEAWQHKNAVGECPKCSREGKFGINSETGQFQCFRGSCKFSGNVTTFLEWKFEECRQAMTRRRLRELADLRGLPIAAFAGQDVGYDPGRREFVLAARNYKGRIAQLRAWHKYPGAKKPALTNTTGLPGSLFGTELLSANLRAILHLCEGEWNALTLRWLLKYLDDGSEHVVVAAPGAAVFQKGWPNAFQGRPIRLWYDQGKAGQDGMAKARRMLAGASKDITHAIWPEEADDGFDVRDAALHFLDKGKTPKQILKRLFGLQSSGKTNGASAQENPKPASGKSVGSGSKPWSFQRALEVFEKHMHMTPVLRQALAVMFATVASAQLSDGDPLWLWAVGPPSSGKTRMAMTMKDLEIVEVNSSLSPSALVSGFIADPDPSLMARMDKRCMLLKDGTSLLTMDPQKRDDVMTILRETFDGIYKRPFGHGKIVVYSAKFSFLGCVTGAIFGHNDSDMGERFLRFYIPLGNRKQRNAIMDASMDATKSGSMAGEKLAEAAEGFLRNSLPSMGELGAPVTEPWKERIKSLAELVSFLRASVAWQQRRTPGEGLPRFMFEREMPGRVANQLQRLAQLLCWVKGLEEMDEETFEIVMKVARDTGAIWHTEAISFLCEGPRRERSKAELAEALGLQANAVQEMLVDLKMMGVIEEHAFGNGGEVFGKKEYIVSREIYEYWHAAGMPAIKGRAARNREVRDARKKAFGKGK